MDLNKLDTVAACSKGAPVHIRDADGNLTDLVIHVVGVDSDVFKAENKKLQGRITMAEKRKRPLEGEELEAAYIQLMVACTLGWENMQLGKEVIEFSKEKATELYTRFPLLKSQVYVALYDRALFLGNLS